MKARSIRRKPRVTSWTLWTNKSSTVVLDRAKSKHTALNCGLVSIILNVGHVPATSTKLMAKSTRSNKCSKTQIIMECGMVENRDGNLRAIKALTNHCPRRKARNLRPPIEKPDTSITRYFYLPRIETMEIERSEPNDREHLFSWVTPSWGGDFLIYSVRMPCNTRATGAPAFGCFWNHRRTTYALRVTTRNKYDFRDGWSPESPSLRTAIHIGLDVGMIIKKEEFCLVHSLGRVKNSKQRQVKPVTQEERYEYPSTQGTQVVLLLLARK